MQSDFTRFSSIYHFAPFGTWMLFAFGPSGITPMPLTPSALPPTLESHAGRGMVLGGRGTGQAQSHPLRIHPWVRPAIWTGPTFGPGHGALATVPWGSPGGGEGLGPRPLLPKWASMSPKPSLSELGFPTWGSEPRGSAHLPGEGEAACLAWLLCEQGLEARPWPSQQKGLHWAEIPPFLPVVPPGPGCWSPEPQPCQFHPSWRGVGLGSFLASDRAWRGRYSTLGSKQGRWTSRPDPWWRW